MPRAKEADGEGVVGDIVHIVGPQREQAVASPAAPFGLGRGEIGAVQARAQRRQFGAGVMAGAGRQSRLAECPGPGAPPRTPLRAARRVAGSRDWPECPGRAVRRRTRRSADRRAAGCRGFPGCRGRAAREKTRGARRAASGCWTWRSPPAVGRTRREVGFVCYFVYKISKI